jgi:transmembrane sensor
VTRETSAEIDSKAAEWAARMDRCQLSAVDRAVLEDWLSGDARRFGAFARACAMMVYLDRTISTSPTDTQTKDVPAHQVSANNH